MAGSKNPGALGTDTNNPVIDDGTSERTDSQNPGPICTVANSTVSRGSGWNWGVWQIIRWKVLPTWLGGDPDILRKYKDAWVRAHKDAILQLSTAYRLPPVLLAGVAWIEVGGDPDWIDTIAYSIRQFDHLADPYLEPLTITKEPELTSFGDISIQLRRAAQAVGLEFERLSSSQRNELIQCLSDEVSNLEIVAKHLWQLKNIDFKNTMVLGDEEIRIIGTRYNRGPQISLEKIKLNTSYGDFILRIKSRLLALIG